MMHNLKRHGIFSIIILVALLTTGCGNNAAENNPGATNSGQVGSSSFAEQSPEEDLDHFEQKFGDTGDYDDIAGTYLDEHEMGIYMFIGYPFR